MKQEFTPKSRFLAASRNEAADRPPCICPGGMMNMMFQEVMDKAQCPWPQTHQDEEKMARLAAVLNREGGFENFGVPFCMTVEAEAMGAAVNMGGSLCEPHVPEALLTSCTQLDLLKRLDVQTGRVKTVLEAIKILKKTSDDVPIIGNIAGPVSVGGTLVDMSVLLKEFRKAPDAAANYLAFISENLIAFGRAQIAAGADAICISEPSGTGEILGPCLFEAYTVKYLNRILDALGPAVKIVHICGKLQNVYELIPRIHCDVFSFDAIVPVREIKQHLVNQAAMGNINTFALGSMPPEKIGKLVKAALEQGADIVAPACGLPLTTPLVNVQAMVSACLHVNEE